DRDQAIEKFEQKLTRAYDHLAEMVEQNPPTATRNRATRGMFVENFLWIAADTTRGAQDVGNCWELCNRNLTGMTDNFDEMARMLKEVELTGTFMARHGGIKSKNSLDSRSGDLDAPKLFTLPKNMLALDDTNAHWTLDKPDAPHWRGGWGTMPSTPVG